MVSVRGGEDDLALAEVSSVRIRRNKFCDTVLKPSGNGEKIAGD
jgi:hypothetical protein